MSGAKKRARRLPAGLGTILADFKISEIFKNIETNPFPPTGTIFWRPETLFTPSRGAVCHMASLEFPKSNDFLFWDALCQILITI